MIEPRQAALPGNTYVERMVLGAILINSNRWPEVADVLSDQDFLLEKHKLIWRRFKDLHAAGTRIDRVTIANILMSRGELEAVDGISYLVSLDDGLPELHNLQNYVQIVKETAVKRRLIFACEELTKIAYSEQSATEVLESARNMVGSLQTQVNPGREFVTLRNLIDDAGGVDAFLNEDQQGVVAAPLDSLQEITGGLQPSDLAIIGAPPGGGKSDFLLFWALHAVLVQGKRVVLLSLEMKPKQVWKRALAQYGQFNRGLWKRMSTATREEREEILRSIYDLIDANLLIRDKSTATVPALLGSVNRALADGPVDLVAIDYLQLMTGDGRDRREQVDNVSRGLKLAANELNTPFIALSQISREGRKMNERPRMEHLREAGGLEQDASLVAFVHACETDYGPDPMIHGEAATRELIIAKQREGIANTMAVVDYWKTTGIFSDKANARAVAA